VSALADGGFGIPSALAEFSDPGLVGYFASAVLGGPQSLPQLGVLATGDIGAGGLSTFFYAASPVARGTQLYTYTGITPTDYTIQYNIDGTMAGGILTQISGGFAVFGSGYNPFQEVQPTLGFSFDHANGDGTQKPVHLSGSVTFAINPGDSFYVQSTLDAYADSRSQSMFALADASHTLTMNFTQGDTSLLTPAAAVPEPRGTFLTGMGIAGLVIAVRRRRCLAGKRASG
jgi:hypothetical protein